MPLQLGQLISDTYRVEKLLGTGGMAEVYRVAHTRLPRQFALKLMRIDGSHLSQFLARFRREAEILGGLRHPHIVDVVDWNQLPDGSPYLVMELLEGEDLASFLHRTGVVSPSVSLHICRQIGEALDVAHSAGVVHRDLKPGNIFLVKNGPFPNFVKVLDFGVAKLVSTDKTPLTANATLMGTPGYMAPEQALGRIDEIDSRTDQFALGAILYEMLSGRPAFFRSGDAIYSILERVVHEQPPPLPQPQVDEATSRAIMRALSKKRDERFPALKAFLAAAGAQAQPLAGSGEAASVVTEVKGSEALAKGGVLSPPSTVQPGELTQPPHARRRLLLMGLLGGAGVLALAAGGYSLHVSTEAPLATPTPSAAPPPPPAPVTVTPPAPITTAPPTAPPTSAPPVELAPPTAVAAPPVAAGAGEVSASVPPPNLELGKVPRVKPLVKGRALPMPRRWLVQGAHDPGQEIAIRLCANKELSEVALPIGTAIKLERSGTLLPVEAPPAVFLTSFPACLRQAFRNIAQNMIPESVTLRLSK